jgi:phosphonate transport system substrate-binding protein
MTARNCTLTRTRRALLALPLWAAGGLRAQARPPLNVALSPFLSPASLLGTFNPLRLHLEQSLARPVELVTARDFRALLAATRRGEHDVVQLPAHLARLAMLDWGWRMLAAPAERVTVIVAVKERSPLRTAAGLRGATVAMLDRLSLTATVGRRWLELNGLAETTTVQALPSINSMLFALDRDEVAAFVAADTQLNSLPAATPRGERVLATIGSVPGPLFVARPTLPADELAALRTAFTTFRPDTSRPPTAANSLLQPLDDARLAALDGFVAIARRALAGTP